MENLDLKDRKILYELDLNCRQSNTQIGKKVGLSKEVTTYRIKRMEVEGIITGYWTEFNTFKLGYNCYRIYINYQDASQNIKDKITKYFAHYKNSWAVISITGPIDLDVMLWVKDSEEFNQFWNKTLDEFGIYFARYTISILTRGVGYKKTYLLYNEYKKINREYFILRSGGKTVNIDKIDYILLNELAINARISLIDLAKKLNCSSQTINYRIKNLIKNGVILALRTNINPNKIGFLNSSIDIYLKNHTIRKQIIEYIQYITNVEYLIENIGWADIQIEIWINNFENLQNIIEDISKHFPDAIRKQDFWISRYYHRLRMLPEITEEDFKKT